MVEKIRLFVILKEKKDGNGTFKNIFKKLVLMAANRTRRSMETSNHQQHYWIQYFRDSASRHQEEKLFKGRRW